MLNHDFSILIGETMDLVKYVAMIYEPKIALHKHTLIQ